MIVREAKPGDARGIARVQVDTWRTTYRGMVPDDYLDGMSYDDKVASFRDTLSRGDSGEYFYVAEEGGAVVGFVICGPERDGNQGYRGEIYAIYVQEAYQRKGIGHALIKASAARLRELGFNSMLIWVLECSPYCRFYERLGGIRIAKKDYVIGGKKLGLVAYGWPDITGL